MSLVGMGRDRPLLSLDGSPPPVQDLRNARFGSSPKFQFEALVVGKMGGIRVRSPAHSLLGRVLLLLLLPLPLMVPSK